LQISDVVSLVDHQKRRAENDRERVRHLRIAVGERLGGSLYGLPPGR